MSMIERHLLLGRVSLWNIMDKQINDLGSRLSTAVLATGELEGRESGPLDCKSPWAKRKKTEIQWLAHGRSPHNMSVGLRMDNPDHTQVDIVDPTYRTSHFTQSSGRRGAVASIPVDVRLACSCRCIATASLNRKKSVPVTYLLVETQRRLVWQVRFDLRGTSDLWGPKRGGLWMWKLVTTPFANVSSSLFTFQDSRPQVKEISYQIFGEIRGYHYWSRRATTTITVEDDCSDKCLFVLQFIKRGIAWYSLFFFELA